MRQGTFAQTASVRSPRLLDAALGTPPYEAMVMNYNGNTTNDYTNNATNNGNVDDANSTTNSNNEL